MSLEKSLEKANLRLKSLGCRFKIDQRGSKLILRGMLLEESGLKKQKRIPLKLEASENSVAPAIALALEMDEAMQTGNASVVTEKRRVVAGPRSEPAQRLLESFRKDYFRKRGETHKSKYFWKKSLYLYLSRLDPKKPVTQAAALRVIRSLPPAAPSRVHAYNGLKRLMRFADIPFDDAKLREELVGCSKHKPAERKLLSDEEIEAYWLKASKREDYQYALAMYATFGIRTSEIHWLDVTPLLAGENYVIVGDGAKTGTKRKAFALPATWIEKFGLRRENPFKLDPARSNPQLSGRICTWFRRNGFPTTYTHRHSFKRRALRASLDPVLVARSMGHSVELAIKDYSRWVADQDVAELFAKASQSR